MKDTLKQEFTRRISMANSTELIVILYDMVLAYADDAQEAFENNQDHDYYVSISRMRNNRSMPRDFRRFSRRVRSHPRSGDLRGTALPR